MPFFSISGSDFVEMFVGVGAARVRDMFEQAKKNAPCIVFIDEIDAVGRQRGAGLGGGNDEREQTLNQLLVEMDGFEGNAGVIVIAATNRPDVLDPALMRPGRFDRQVVVPLPDIRGREQILLVHMRKVPMATDVKAEVIARGTPGFSGADLANLVNEAALFAARKNKRLVDMDDFEMAKDKIVMGAERRSMVMPEEERRNTAYHESGHAIVARLLPKTDPVHKVTIIPRGRALGVTMQLPEQDRYSMDRNHMLNVIAVLFGGRISEELFMNQMTTGASNDFERATHIARDMVTRYGMSDLMGPMVYGENEGEVFLGRSITRTVNMSEETMRKVDGEIRKIIDQQYAVARKLLEDNRDKVEAMATALLELETIDADQIDDIMSGQPPRPPKPTQSGSGSSTTGRRAGRGRRAVGESGLKTRRSRLDAFVARTPGRTQAAPRVARAARALALPTSDRRSPLPVLRCGRYTFELSRPLVMGILNVTPDSFSDGGRFVDRGARARARAADARRRRRPDRHRRRIVAARRRAGRPRARSSTRVMPLVEALAGEGIAIAVDTRKPAVMRAAIAAGAAMINDIGALTRAGRDRGVRRERRRRLPDAHAARAADDAGGAGLRRRRGRGPRLSSSRAPQACVAAGIARERIAIDPGFGFGKTLAHNLALLRSLGTFAATGYPVVAGLSRKSSLGAITGRSVDERMPASLAAALAAVARGAAIVRVHDVRETVDALKVWHAVEHGAGLSELGRR